jgi:hypothetical protein
MATEKQKLGKRGEEAVVARASCPQCNRPRTFWRLPANFQCADLICKFCGHLAQVKAVTLKQGYDFPEKILGGAWGPQQEQILAGIFHDLYLVGFAASGHLREIRHVPGHILRATPSVFEPRRPLSEKARRAGWQGFYYNIGELPPIGVRRVFTKN